MDWSPLLRKDTYVDEDGYVDQPAPLASESYPSQLRTCKTSRGDAVPRYLVDSHYLLEGSLLRGS